MDEHIATLTVDGYVVDIVGLVTPGETPEGQYDGYDCWVGEDLLNAGDTLDDYPTAGEISDLLRQRGYREWS